MVSLSILGTTLSVVSNAHAENLMISGGQASRTSDFAYIGVITPLGQARLGDGIFLSPILDISRYTFNQSHTGFTGLQPSASLALGYATAINGTNISLSVAGGYAHTSLSPYVPSGSMNGSAVFVEPEIYMHIPLPAHASLTANGGYLLGLRSYWFLTYAAIPIGGAFSIGPEIDLGGGPNYRSRVIAMRGNGNITPKLGFSVTLGAIADAAGSFTPYAGFTLNYPFP